MHLSHTLLTLAALCTTPSLAWGTLGHRTTAALASLHFTPLALKWTNTLLNAQDLTEASLFPDKIRYIPSFAYTAPWHFIDAADSPPHSCGINITRDCLAAGCVVSAIANHTGRVIDPNLPHWQRGQSLRFVLHFFGDVHQPLHTEGMDRGGNEIGVFWEGRAASLHAVWDTLVANKVTGRTTENEEEVAWRWAGDLEERAGRGEFDVEEVSEVCVEDAAECALGWAGEANRWVCDYVLSDGKEGVLGRELGGEYYEGAVGVVEEMIVKGGRRLGAWVNLLAERAAREEMLKLEVQEL